MLRRTFLKQMGTVLLSLFLGERFSLRTVPGVIAPPKKTEHFRLSGGDFELPLNGATGFASVELPLISSFDNPVTLKAGTPFTILEENGKLFRIRLADGATGYIESRFCLVNLPDIIPSIVYKDTNSDASIFRSLGYELPGITGEKLYEARFANERLSRDEYVMPLLYGMTRKVMRLQQTALTNGETLVIYETYRPRETQKAVGEALNRLIDTNSNVKGAVHQAPWGPGWFIARGVSNHQRGVAMDVSLASVKKRRWIRCGDFRCAVTEEWEELAQPTPMHELSPRAAAHKDPVLSRSHNAWRTAIPADSMTEAALRLQRYATDCGLTPISSEWWHFNDLDTLEDIMDHSSDGEYFLPACLSCPPPGGLA